MNKMNWKKELLLTLSKKASLLCSKKIERMISFGLGCLVLFVYFIVKIFCFFNCEFTSTDAVLISGTLFSYGGYNSYRIRKDLDADKNTNNENTEIKPTA